VINKQEYFQHLNILLDLEAEAEKQAALVNLQRLAPVVAEATGDCLTQMVIREENAGLGGRYLLTLAKRNQNLSLPWTRLSVGTPVILSEQDNHGAVDPHQEGWRGVISRMDRESIEIAFSCQPTTQSDRPVFRIDRSGDEISRQRQRKAMQTVQSAYNNRLADLRDILLNVYPPEFNSEGQCQFLDPDLNESQQIAVQFCLTAEDVAIIHGPPGTGKTRTVVELIRQLVQRSQTVLAGAPSNLAVDHLMEQLLAAGESPLRLGHPARVVPELRSRTLDEMVENHPDVKLAKKLVREAYALRAQADKYTRAKPEPGYREALRSEAKEMLQEARQIENRVIESLLGSTQVICATATGLSNSLLKDKTFDWCVMDEASQATEPVAWVPLPRVNHFILAGDHCQLPPTVVSPKAAAQGLNISLMERLLSKDEHAISRQLIVQYRMHPDIMKFSSKAFYRDTLQADAQLGGLCLKDLPGVEENLLTSEPVTFIDTAGASYDELNEMDGESRLNPQEAELVAKKVTEFLSAGLSPKDLAIITPYAAQVRHLRSLVNIDEIEIDTVDGFQGREKMAVIVSLVRSNTDGEIGFLGDTRRMNVALTRARRKLIVIGDSATISAHPFYQSLVNYFEEIGAYHSIWEEDW
jgi:superfamily I DNA and/or RNA helicase